MAADALDPALARPWAVACVEALTACRDELDRVNVFPVPDADTGANLLATMTAAVAAIDSGPDPLAALAAGAACGARGNSGIVLSQLLRGFAEERGRVAAAIAAGARLARVAFSRPVDGTALTVLDAAARHARATSAPVAAETALAAAAAELARTPSQLPVLAEAGVVDAGGWGVVLVLEALVAVLTGTPLPAHATAPPAAEPEQESAGAAACPGQGPVEQGGGAYEVMYLLDGTTEARVATLRAALDGIGESVAVAGGPAGWTVHVHCDDVGAAIEAGIQAGRPHRIGVAPLAPATRRWARERAVVVVTPWPGVARLARGEGVDGDTVVAAEGEDDVLAAVVGVDARHVVVLPGTGDASGAAHRAARRAREQGCDVAVVPTTSPVQALAALAVHDGARHASDDVVTMAEAAAATRCGEVVIATEEALTWAGRCRPGDALGLADGEVVVIAQATVDAACRLVDLMLTAGGELVTALVGAGQPPELATALRARLRRSHPEVELAVYDGGQDVPLLVGVE